MYYVSGNAYADMLKALEKMFTRFLHLSDPWEVNSVILDDAETRVDIRLRCAGRLDLIRPDCGCGCRGYDSRER